MTGAPQPSAPHPSAGQPSAPQHDDRAEGARQLFLECYGTEPDGVWHGPGRVNFIGEHTDYNGGFALPFAISSGVFVAAAARDDGIVALSSRQYGGAAVTVPVADLGPGRVHGWAAYPAGVVWALQVRRLPRQRGQPGRRC